MLKLIYLLAVAAVVIIIAPGCIKENGNGFTNQSSVSPNTVDFINQRESAAGLVRSNTPTIYTFFAELNSADKSYPAGDITIDKDIDIVTSNGREFLPDSAYQLLNTTATIDPVTHLAAFQLNIFTNKVDDTHDFAVGFRITGAPSGTIIGSNKNTIMISVTVRNKYDGIYSLNITTIGWDAFAISDNQPGDYGDVALVTNTANSASFLNLVLETDLQPAFTTDNAGITQLGAISPLFFFDVTDKLINVDNTYPDDGRGRDYAINPAAGLMDNRYDAATQTFFVNVLIKQTGRPDMTTIMVMKFVGPR